MWSRSLRFPHQNPKDASPLFHTRYMPRPSYSSRFYHPKDIGRGVQIIRLLILQLPPLLFTLLLLLVVVVVVVVVVIVVVVVVLLLL